jgi:membrane-associated phospholipid phosphatase
VLSWLFWVVLYAWVPIVCYRLFDDSDEDKLIVTGAAILIAGITADNLNLWLKQVASRPRFKYLITLNDPVSEYRNWWQMIPNLAGSNDNYKSWPSGNMTIASMMFSLPMLSDVLKKRSDKKNMVCFVIALCFVIIYGYNRIHMTNHFLSDVCFGTLITYILYSVVSSVFLDSARK